MAELSVKRYDATTGSLLGTITNGVKSCPVEYRLVGGALRATLTFAAAWADGFLASIGEEIRILRDRVPVFRGRVSEVLPRIERSEQEVECAGWWQRFNELTIVDEALADRLVFGIADDSDHPEVLTAYDLIVWLFENVIATDTLSPVVASDFTAPTHPAKFGNGGFAIHAGEKLCTVLETLAAAEDMALGVDALGVLYGKPRATVLATPSVEVRVAEALTGAWRIGTKAWGLSGRFIQERRGPNVLHIASRDKNLARGLRTYLYKDALPHTWRRGFYRAPGVRTGQMARRVAKGLLRRFSSYGLKIESVEGLTIARRFEPHLGKFAVYSASVLQVEGLAGAVTVDWAAASVRPSITLGENDESAGSNNPLNDLFDPTLGMMAPDDPQVDTGSGSEEYPGASWEIDESDGWDGDGDDLFSNDDRYDWTDPPGAGVDGLDYGTDLIDSTNGAGGGGSGGGVQTWKGLVTAVTAPTYSVTVLNADGTTYATHTGVVSRPVPVVPFEVDDEVVVFYPRNASEPVIIGHPNVTAETVSVAYLTGDFRFFGLG